MRLQNIMIAACVALFAGGASAQSFNDILGRTLSNDTGSLVINSNRTVTGTINGQNVNLRWWSEDGLFCREGSLGSTAIPARCQTVRIRNGQITFVNSDGQVSSTYTIN